MYYLLINEDIIQNIIISVREPYPYIMKSVILTGIDSTGKSTLAKYIQSNFKNTFLRKYPHDEEIKSHINNYYNRIVNSGKELHESAITNMYRQVHDLYDRDFRIPFTVPEGTELLLFDRYFIDNIVYSRMNGVEREVYSEDHTFVPDLVIFLKSRHYGEWKKTFKMKGDENIREPLILFESAQPEFLTVLSQLQEQKKIKRFTVITALEPTTNQEVKEAIESLLATVPA